jgi:hypothetical protein
MDHRVTLPRQLLQFFAVERLLDWRSDTPRLSSVSSSAPTVLTHQKIEQHRLARCRAPHIVINRRGGGADQAWP